MGICPLISCGRMTGPYPLYLCRADTGTSALLYGHLLSVYTWLPDLGERIPFCFLIFFLQDLIRPGGSTSHKCIYIRRSIEKNVGLSQVTEKLTARPNRASCERDKEGVRGPHEAKKHVWLVVYVNLNNDILFFFGLLNILLGTVGSCIFV